MRLLLLAACLPLVIHAQDCSPAGTLLPSSQRSGVLSDANCKLSDGASFAAYTLVLPVRGRIQIDLTSDVAGLALQLRDSYDAGIDQGRSIRRAIERGTYTLLVNARTGENGAYSLKSSFTAEPGMLCRDFPSIGLNQQTSGTLGGSGCLRPDGAPYEQYALHTFGDGTIVISASSDAFQPKLTLRSESGRALATGTGTLSYAVEGDGNYGVVVSGGDGGDYQISTAFRSADAETCRSQATLTATKQYSGVINPLSCSTVINEIGDQEYFTYYELQVSDAGIADIAVSSSLFDPIVSLLDAGGNVIGTDTLAGGKGKSVLHMWLAAGSYVVKLQAAQPSGGAYTMQYTFSAGPPENCPVLTLGADDALTGTLCSTSCRSTLGIADQYTLTLPADGTVQVGMSSVLFPAVLSIRDPRDNVLVWDDAAGGLGASLLVADLPAGTYRVTAASTGGAGAYQLSSKFTPHALGSCAAAPEIKPNAGYIQQLGLNPCRGANGQPRDDYQFTLPADGMVAVVMTSSDLDGYLTLTDASGNFVRSDDNSYGYGDPLILQYLPAGTYKLAARAFETSFGGLYRVDVLFQQGPRPPGCALRGTLTPGTPATGNINYSGCQYTDDTFADVWEFKLSSDATIDLTLDGSGFDPALVLLDAAGNVVDNDDDGGTAGNSRIRRALPAGVYTVIAKSAVDYTETGDYTLNLKLQ